MTKLSKKDFDEYFGQEAFYSNKDKNTFYQNLHKVKKDKKNFLPKILTAVVGLAVLFFAIQFTQGDNPLSPSDMGVQVGDNHDMKTAETLEEVEAYFYEMTPGLKRAEELGLVTEVDETFSINEEYDIHIDKIWYSSEEIFYFYSIGKKDGSSFTLGEEGPHISGLTVLEGQGVESRPLSFYTLNMGPWEGMIYNNRYYHRATSTVLEKEPGTPIEEINEKLDIKLTVKLHERYVSNEFADIPFEFSTIAQNEQIIGMDLNEQMAIQGVDLTFDRLEVDVVENRLYATVENENNHKPYEMKGVLTTDKGEEMTLYGYPTEKQNKIIFTFNAFNELPNELYVDIESVRFIGEDNFQFQIDVRDYHQKPDGYEDNLHQKITEIKDTTIFLEQLYYDERGVNFNILYEEKTSNQTVKLVASGPSVGDENEHFEFANTVVTARNEKGEPGIYGSRGEGPGNQFGLFLEEEFVSASETIDITIEKLLYEVLFNQSVKIQIQKGK